MDYQVILTQNGTLKKVLYQSKNKAHAFTEYRKFIGESDAVIYEKKHVNSNGIIPVKYLLYIVKENREGESRRYVRNSIGKLIEEDLLFGQWIIMDSIDFRVEEDVWVYGFSPKTERKTIKDVVTLLMKGLGTVRSNKEVIVVHNKLVIYNETEFDMVICKCLSDAQRLHHLLYSASIGSKIKGLLFMGTANPVTISQLYEIIHEETKWPMDKIRRTTTRP